jgi:hypothetical protein
MSPGDLPSRSQPPLQERGMLWRRPSLPTKALQKVEPKLPTEDIACQQVIDCFHQLATQRIVVTVQEPMSPSQLRSPASVLNR